MGLMYQFPNDITDSDHVIIDDQKILVRTYGLPPLFWLYGTVCVLFVIVLSVGIWSPLMKLLSYDDTINNIIGYSLLSILFFLPLTIAAFFFYEKNLLKSNQTFIVIHKLFFIPIQKKIFENITSPIFEIKHFIDSPNMARLQDQKEFLGFQNKGYFILFLKYNDQLVAIDRSSRKADLEKLIKILS